MIDWEALCEAGVPLGATRAVEATAEPARVRRALAQAAREPLDEAERVALRAWLAGFAHHWPARFARVTGDEGAALLERLGAGEVDANRYLKLRRIAIERLAGLVERR